MIKLRKNEKIIARMIVPFDEDLLLKDQLFLIETENGFKLRDFSGSYIEISIRKRRENYEIIQKKRIKETSGKERKIESDKVIEKKVSKESKKKCLEHLLKNKFPLGLHTECWNDCYFTYIRAHSCICIKGELAVR